MISIKQFFQQYGSKIAKSIGVVFGIGCIVMVVWMGYLDIQVREKFEGKRWKVPAKVYASPMELYVGANISQQDLLGELKRLNYRVDQKVAMPGHYYRVGNRIDLYSRGFTFWDGEEQAIKLSVIFSKKRIRGLSHQGKKLDLVRLEPLKIGGIYGSEKEDRYLVQLSDVPPLLINGLIAVEDRQFYDHFGLSFRGIARAAWVNATEGRWAQGGSTITQQLVKNFYLHNERTLSRKVVEAMMALLLEMHYSKADILEAYINEVYLGQQGSWAIHGMGLASQFYFGQPLSGLSVEQTALLIAIIKGPSYYNPIRNPKRAKKRRDQVIALMSDAKLIESEKVDEWIAQPLGLVSSAERSTNLYPGFMSLVKRQLQMEYDAEDLQTEGLRIFTTLDPRLQSIAERSLQKRVSQLEKLGKGKGGELQGAFVVTSPENGEVLALVSDKNPRYPGFNRVLDARRQVGSVIKPAVFLAALEQREQYQWTSLVSDSPFSLSLPNGDSWQPENFDQQSHGELIMLEALVKSYNQATAQLAMDIGLDRVLDVIRRLGIDQSLPKVPAISLGAVELTPIEVAKIYQTIAAGGFSSSISPIREILDGQGQPLKRYPLKVEQVFDQVSISLLQFGLQEVMYRGTGVSAYARLPNSLGLAGKTGTTNDQRDSWFAGMSGNYLAVAWLGRDDNQSTGLTGSTGALKVWSDFMYQSSPTPFQPLDSLDVELSWAHRSLGRLTDKSCTDAVMVAIDMRHQDLTKQGCLVERFQRWIQGR